MRAIDIDVAGKPAELTGRRPEELVDAKSNRRMRYVEFEGLVRDRVRDERCENQGEPAKSNHVFHRKYSFVLKRVAAEATLRQALEFILSARQSFGPPTAATQASSIVAYALTVTSRTDCPAQRPDCF